jgi:hypothetical protein
MWRNPTCSLNCGGELTYFGTQAGQPNYDRIAVSFVRRGLGIATVLALVSPLTTGCGRVGLKLLEQPPTIDSPNGSEDPGGLLNGRDGGSSMGDADVETCAPTDCDCLLAMSPVPTAHWLLDEASGTTAQEAMGGAPAGTLTNFADTAGMAWMAGRVDGALNFDGVDDHVQIGAAGSARSLAFWAKPANSVAITNQTPGLFPSTTGPNEDWSSPERAFSEGNLNLVGTREQHWGGFHIPAQLPPGVSIVGITVSLKSASFGVIQGIGVELSWDGGQSHTDANYGGVALVGSSDVSAYGGKDQSWGRTWQPQDLTDENFRVRVALSGLLSFTASVDYVSVQIQYSDYANPRNILSLSTTTKVEFTDAQMTFAATGWPGATTYVNGVVGGTLSSDWNHVVITGTESIDVNQLQLGNVTAESPGYAYQGLLDDVALFDEALSAEQVQGLAGLAGCP